MPGRRESFVLYLRAVAGHWVALVGGALLATGAVVISAFAWQVSPVVWGLTIAVGLSVAQFLAFHDLRLQRDEAVAAMQSHQADLDVVVEGLVFADEFTATVINLGPETELAVAYIGPGGKLDLLWEPESMPRGRLLSGQSRSFKVPLEIRRSGWRFTIAVYREGGPPESFEFETENVLLGIVQIRSVGGQWPPLPQNWRRRAEILLRRLEEISSGVDRVDEADLLATRDLVELARRAHVLAESSTICGVSFAHQPTEAVSMAGLRPGAKHPSDAEACKSFLALALAFMVSETEHTLSEPTR